MRLLLSLLAVPVWALGITVQPLPPCEFADTEATTYAPLLIPARNSRGLELSLEFNGTSSNNVEVALGHDADGDGRLDWRETSLMLGWDCGRYFVEHVESGERFEETADSVVLSRRLFWHSAVKRDRLMGVAVSNETGAAFTSFATNPPAWVHSSDWNLMRLTARGPDAPNERFSVDVLEAGFLIQLK